MQSVIKRDRDNNKPIETKTDPVEQAKTTFFRPFKSAYLGTDNEEIIQPKKKLLPIDPICTGVAHIRSSY